MGGYWVRSRCREIKLRREDGRALEGASLEIFRVILPAGYLCVRAGVCDRNAGQTRALGVVNADWTGRVARVK